MFPTNVPKLAIPRSGFYAGCTRDDLVSILYPFGRESMLSIGPSLSASHRAESKRNRLGGMVRSVSGLFRRDKTNKLKGTASTVEPLSPPVGLRFLGALFDASQEFDGERSKYQGVARLASGSGPADVLNELIDAYSNREPGSNLGSDSSSNLADILAKFPVVPASSSVPAPRVGHLGCSSDIPGGLVVGGRVVSVNRSADPHQDSLSNNTRLIPASSVPFFERRPSSGEFNRISVFKRVSAVIQKRRIRPLRLLSGVKESMASGPNEINLALAQHYLIQGSPVAALPLVPDLVVTNHDDNTMVVVALDEGEGEGEGEEPTDEVVPGLLFPSYVRRHYPGDGRLAGPPRLTLSMSGWNIDLQAIDEEGEEMADSCLFDRASEPDLELASGSGSSSPELTPPTTPTFVDTLLTPTTAGVSSKPTPKNLTVVDGGMGANGDDAAGITL